MSNTLNTKNLEIPCIASKILEEKNIRKKKTITNSFNQKTQEKRIKKA